MPKKKAKSRSSPPPNFPPHHPDAIAREADAMPWKTKVRLPEVESYGDAIHKLHERGYSFAEITDWLNTKLADTLGERKIKRGQVSRVHQQVLRNRNRTDPLFAEVEFPHLRDEEEAEEKADLEDRRRSETKE